MGLAESEPKWVAHVLLLPSHPLSPVPRGWMPLWDGGVGQGTYQAFRISSHDHASPPRGSSLDSLSIFLHLVLSLV